MSARFSILRPALFVSSLLALAACSGGLGGSRTVETEAPGRGGNAGPEGRIFGDLNLFGGGGNQQQQLDPGIGVNSFLWRASLDTVGFMPLASADPFGGVIITDWYSPPQTPGERFKVTVYILDRALRADGVKVAVFKQAQTPTGWTDRAVGPETVAQMENAILTRARQLRLQAGE